MVWPTRASFNRSRKSRTPSGPIGAESSTLRWSTRPASVISTSKSRVGVSSTTSQCFTRDTVSVGSCTTAAWLVSWASSCTERRSTSSKSTPFSKKSKMAWRSAALSGLTSCSASTNAR